MSQVSVKNTKILLKNGTEADWNKLSTFVPGKGEVIIFNVDADHATPRLKIGDGETLLSELPFVASSDIPGFDPDNIVAKRVGHKLTFGSGEVYQFDGSSDVTVPVYTGNYREYNN